MQSSEGLFAAIRRNGIREPAKSKSNPVALVTLPNRSDSRPAELRDELRRVSET